MKPVHLCCGKNTPNKALEYIQVIRNRVIATNGSVLIVLPVEEVFGPDIIRDGEELYFVGEAWGKQKFDKAEFISREGKRFYAESKKSITFLDAITKEDLFVNINRAYPCVDNVMPRNVHPIRNITVNPFLLANLTKAFGQPVIRMQFDTNQRGVVCMHPDSKGVGLIMPCMLNDYNIDINERLGLKEGKK